jgi:hypothetical protein
MLRSNRLHYIVMEHCCDTLTSDQKVKTQKGRKNVKKIWENDMIDRRWYCKEQHCLCVFHLRSRYIVISTLSSQAIDSCLCSIYCSHNDRMTLINQVLVSLERIPTLPKSQHALFHYCTFLQTILWQNMLLEFAQIIESQDAPPLII